MIFDILYLGFLYLLSLCRCLFGQIYRLGQVITVVIGLGVGGERFFTIGLKGLYLVCIILESILRVTSRNVEHGSLSGIVANRFYGRAVKKEREINQLTSIRTVIGIQVDEYATMTGNVEFSLQEEFPV